MGQVTEQQILNTLTATAAPESKRDIVGLGMVSGMVIKDGSGGILLFGKSRPWDRDRRSSTVSPGVWASK